MKTEKLIDSGSGTGKLLDASGFFDQVKYEYQLFQEIINTDTLSGMYSVPGITKLRGRITLLNKKEMIIRKNFTLETSSGKTFRILISSGGYPLTTFEFITGQPNE